MSKSNNNMYPAPRLNWHKGGLDPSILKGLSQEWACPKNGPVPRMGLSQEWACPKSGPVPRVGLSQEWACQHSIIIEEIPVAKKQREASCQTKMRRKVHSNNPKEKPFSQASTFFQDVVGCNAIKHINESNSLDLAFLEMFWSLGRKMQLSARERFKLSDLRIPHEGRSAM